MLANIAMCKWHRLSQLGQLAMIMKNHFGTFAPGPGHAKKGKVWTILLALTNLPRFSVSWTRKQVRYSTHVSSFVLLMPSGSSGRGPLVIPAINRISPAWGCFPRLLIMCSQPDYAETRWAALWIWMPPSGCLRILDTPKLIFRMAAILLKYDQNHVVSILTC